MHRPLLRIVILAIVVMPQPMLATCPLLKPQVVSFLQEASTGKWHNSNNQGIAAFLCCTDSEIATFLRELQSGTSPVLISTPEDWQKTLAKMAAASKVHKLTYMVDLKCPGLEDLIGRAGKYRLTGIPNRWLLLNITTEQTVSRASETALSDKFKQDTECHRLANFLTQSAPEFQVLTATNADVTLVCGTARNGVALVDLWAATPLGSWSPGRGFYGDRRVPALRRLAVGLNGYEIKVGLKLENNDSLMHMNDGLETKIDVLTKFNWEITLNVVKMLNASMSLHQGSTYGYVINGSWNGLVGMQIRREIELTTSAMAVVNGRVPFVHYTNFPLPEFGIFIFRAPPMSYEHNIFTQPFPASLWLCAIGIVVLCAALLYGALKVEDLLGIEGDNQQQLKSKGIVLSEGRKRRLEASWTDVALLAIGAVCQQGSPTEARGLTGRIITIFMFIGILFLYVSYSASIIALLQSTSTSIKSYKDILTSKIKVGAENHEYNTQYLKYLQDPIRKAIYEKKMKNNFMTIEEGIRRVRTSYFAFHTMRSLIYAEIAETFQESEKCGLVEILNFLYLQNPMTAISKWSENTEMIMLSIRRQHENGIYHRQTTRFLHTKPPCTTKGANFASVALIDCEVAFYVLGMGFGTSLLLFLVEFLAARYHNIMKIHSIKNQETT